MAFSENNKSRVVCFSKRHSICKRGKENLNVELELFANTLNSENWVFEALERGHMSCSLQWKLIAGKNSEPMGHLCVCMCLCTPFESKTLYIIQMALPHI